MLTIYKFPFSAWPMHAALEVPYLVNPLHFAMQGGIPTIWGVVDADKRGEESRTFIMVGTGHPLPTELVTNGTYVGTCQDGEYVWHCFMVEP